MIISCLKINTEEKEEEEEANKKAHTKQRNFQYTTTQTNKQRINDCL